MNLGFEEIIDKKMVWNCPETALISHFELRQSTGLFISFHTLEMTFFGELFHLNFFRENTKWKKGSYTHYLKILIKLSKHGLSYSLKRDWRSISKITFYANWRVSPIDTEIWELFKQKLLFVIRRMRSVVEWICLIIFQFWKDNTVFWKK